MKKTIMLTLAFFFAMLPCAALAQERILSFNAALETRADASVDITEEITVNVQGQKIRRGLVRVLPVNNERPVKITGLEMDGAPHPYFTEKRGKNLEVNFGNDAFLTHGIHTYKLSYTIKNAVGFFKDYDEVYWNVTGNDWDFPIERAAAARTLPAGANAIQEKISTYTGPFGSKTTTAVQTGPLSFETTGPLYQGHGLTVAVPWQKGVLKAPTVSLTPYIPAAYALLLLIILIIYCFITWKKYGKDPTDPVVTEYAPPEDISPALMRTIIRKNPDTKAFATAIISLAMKGKITITQEKSFLSSKTFLNKVDNSPNNVAKEEMPILDRTYGSFELSQANYSLLHTSMDKVREYLNADAEIYIEPNTKHLIIPAAIILLMLLPLLFKAPVLFFATLIYFTVLYFFLSPAVSVKGSGTTGAIISTGIFLALTIEAFFVMSRPSLIYFAMLVPVFVCFVVYSTLIDNYTERGRELINRIKGFKHYMSIAEEGRVALSDPMDAERIFADYLPYAFALDMENKWFKKFEGIISAAVIEKTVARAGGMRFARGSALIGAINAAQPRSSGGGSSGSGGGGFSGGGFGGGGGGGR